MAQYGGSDRCEDAGQLSANPVDADGLPHRPGRPVQKRGGRVVVDAGTEPYCGDGDSERQGRRSERDTEGRHCGNCQGGDDDSPLAEPVREDAARNLHRSVQYPHAGEREPDAPGRRLERPDELRTTGPRTT